jgi:hypothetical protein
MHTHNPPDAEKVNKLKHQIHGFLLYSWRLHTRNDRLNTALIVVGLVLGASVTIVGFLGYGFVAGVIGAITTLFIGFQNAFNFAEKAGFYSVIHNEAKTLRDHLNYKVHSTAEFEAVVDALAALRIHLAQNLPKGQGMEEVKKLCATIPPEGQRPRNV